MFRETKKHAITDESAWSREHAPQDDGLKDLHKGFKPDIAEVARALGPTMVDEHVILLDIDPQVQTINNDQP